MKSKSTLQLFIHTPSDQVITLNNLHPDALIQDLKSALELKSGILAEYQNLLINNTKLENGKTLADCKVKSGSFVRLRLKENSLEQIYVNSINGKTDDVFMLGVQKIESDGDTNDELNDEEEQIKAWNAFVPYRAFQGLFAACFGGQLNLMTQLLMKSAGDIKMTTKNGRTLLHAAASQGHLLCVDFLLAQGVDTKQADKYGMTALMIAAEYGFVKVEKRIWLYSWNMSVLDDFIQSDEKIVGEEKNRAEQSTLHDEGKQKTKQLQEDRKAERERFEDRDRILEPSKDLDDAPKPVEQKFEKQGTRKEKEDREEIKLPSITKTDDDNNRRQGKQNKPRPFKLPTVREKVEKSENRTFHKSSNPELNVSAINNSNRIKEIKENVAKSKIILQTEERNIRVSAWIHDNTHDVSGKCPLRPLSPSPQPTLTGPGQIPYMPGAFKPTKPLLQRKQKDYEKISAESNVPIEEKSKLQSQARSVQSEGNDMKTGTSVTNIDLGEEFDLMATFLRKGLVRTERNTVEKYNQEMKKRESKPHKKRTIEGRFIDTIQQISDETMSFSRSLLMLSPGCLNEDNEKPPIKSTSIRIPISQDTLPANDITEQAFTVPRKNIIRCKNNALDDSQSEPYEHVWRPIESQLDPTDSSSFYARFGKTYDEWLKEKRKLKRSQTKKDDECEPMTDNETEIDKTEKNEEAFSRWLYTKERERLKMKVESRTTKTDSTDEKPLQTGITFDEWKKIKKNIQQAQNEILSRKRPPQRIKRGMTFDQWKTWKSEQRKAMKDKQEDTTGEIDDRKLGLSFEKWVRKKDELKKLEDSIIALTKEKEEKRKAFLLQFRLNDPRQRTFEEWYLEKKHEFLKQKKKREESKEKKKERYPEDSELIFNMWLLNKYQMEMCNEKGKYRNTKRRNKLEQMEAIEETDADYASSFESDLSD